MDADFVGVPRTGDAPLEVTFTDTTTGEPETWLWDFGDGETSVEQHPVHEYAADGTYTVSLTVTNSETTGADFVGASAGVLNPLWTPLYQVGDPGFGLDSDGLGTLEKVSVSGDVITITADKVGAIWETAFLGTRTTYSFLYGTMEVDVDYPNGMGVWPAAWLLEAGVLTTPPEVDILEAYPGDPAAIGGPDWISTSLHTAGPVQTTQYDTGSNNTGEWHTYKMVWGPGSMKFYFDGSQYWQTTTSVPAVALYPIINLALGATGYRTDGSTPSTLVMQARVRIWEGVY